MRRATIAIPVSLFLAASAFAQESGPDPELVEKIEALGGRVHQVAQSDPRLEVSFHLGRDRDGLRTQDASGGSAAEPAGLDEGLAMLGDLGEVMAVQLGGTDVTDAGLAHLAALASLERLHLERTAVTDSGLAHLAGLASLSYLNLYGTGVTDAGLAHLKGLSSLRSLYLWQTEVTDEAVEDLQGALPDCAIDRGWESPEPPAGEESGADADSDAAPEN